MSLIQIKNVKKYYLLGKTIVPALRGVNLDIEKGDFIALMGASGCGKSTLLNCIAGNIEFDEGSILIDNHDLAAMDDEQRSLMRLLKMGYVYQFFNLLPLISAIDNVKIPLSLVKSNKKSISKKDMHQRALSLLESVCLHDREKHKPSELSGGEQQRVAIARALANNPDILLLDEPTGNLDEKTGDAIIELLSQLHKDGRTIIMATHSDKIARYCSRKIRLSDGKIIES